MPANVPGVSSRKKEAELTIMIQMIMLAGGKYRGMEKGR